MAYQVTGKLETEFANLSDEGIKGEMQNRIKNYTKILDDITSLIEANVSPSKVVGQECQIGYFTKFILERFSKILNDKYKGQENLAQYVARIVLNLLMVPLIRQML